MSPTFALFAAVLAAADAGAAPPAPPGAAAPPAPAVAPAPAKASFEIPAAGYTPETACNDYELQVMLVANATKSAPNRMNIERRMSDTLAEERRLEAMAAPDHRPGHSLPIVLLVLGVALVIAGSSRKSLALAIAGALSVAAAGGLSTQAEHSQLALRTRLWEVRSCRLKLLESRTQIEHGEYARCLDDLGEADEDLLLWGAQVRAGHPVRMDQIEKLRKELMHRP